MTRRGLGEAPEQGERRWAICEDRRKAPKKTSNFQNLKLQKNLKLQVSSVWMKTPCIVLYNGTPEVSPGMKLLRYRVR
jgi:hypothetical protein